VNLDANAERDLLGCVFLRGGEILDRVELQAEDFADPRHRRVWAAMLDLHGDSGKPDDVDLVAGKLGAELRAVGGLEYLTTLAAAVPCADNADHYAAAIRNAALKRNLAVGLADIIGAARDVDANAEDVLARAYAALSKVAERQPDPTKPIGQWVKATFMALSRAAEEHGSLGLLTGIEPLDNLTGGIRRGVVTILAGRPSQGKSSLARTIVDNVNAAGFGVHVFSLEDSAEAYCLRALSDASRVDLQRLSTAKLEGGDLDGIRAAAGRIFQRTGWLLDETPGLNAQQIGMRVRKHRRANNTALVVVDYVQLMRERARDRRGEIEAAVLGLEDLARNERLAVILLSQINRAAVQTEGKRPEMHSLSESGVLEQKAAAILAVHRPEMYAKNDKERAELAGKAELLVLKNKNGRTGTVNLYWDGPTATYRNPSRREW
jgi:replicative DNA helicase